MEIDNNVTISPKLLGGMSRLQDIFTCWFPALNKIEIIGNTEESVNCHTGAASFYSGGIDGLYTLKTRQDEITHLVYINGFDFEMTPERFAASVARHSRVVGSFQKTLLPVETNFYSFNQHVNIHRPISHGSCLASVAVVLGFPKTYIPSSYSYSGLHPWGSHPLTDVLWSTEGSEIVHDTCARRTEKTSRLVDDPIVVDNLVVCWHQADHNCGKCLRTMITLKLLGVRSKAFPETLRVRDLHQIKITSYEDLSYFYENLDLAIAQKEWMMANALKRFIQKTEFMLSIKEFDRRCLNGLFRKIYQRRILPILQKK